MYGWQKRIIKSFSLGVFAAGLFFALPILPSSAQAKTVKDILGRNVSVPDHPKRILLGEGRLIYALEPLEGKNLFDRVVGWQGEFKQADTQTYTKIKKSFPEMDKVAVIGKTTADSVNPEKVLDLNPDLVILSTSGHGPGLEDPLTLRLQKANIPIIFVDFRHDPVTNTVPSLRLLGEALDRQAEAKAYTDFYKKRLDLIQSRLKDLPVSKRPTVFLDMLAGARPCCHTAGNGNMGHFVDAAGGKNVAAALLPGVFGEVSIEQVIASNPDFIVMDGTRGPLAEGPGLRMGALVNPDDARNSLNQLSKMPALANLKASKEKHIYGIWHSYYDNPFNIVAIEAMAKWFHPDLFADLDPDADLNLIENRFTSIGSGGTYWTSLEEPVFLKDKSASKKSY
ncbi:iron ABC transporter substrate-binding protein [Acetobacteraceae bacterium]|nr:iron ABC transporter substrate-binding protein [Acetobacteraceae bacterium]